MVDNSENESDCEYSKGEHERGNDDTEDEGVPNTMIVVRHAEDTPPFIRALHLEVMHAPEFPEYANMVSGYIANGEFHVGMIFSDQEAVIRIVKNYSIFRSMDYKVQSQNE